MSVVDKNGYPLRLRQLVRVDDVHDHDCEVLEVSKQHPCVYLIGYWVRLRTPLGCHSIQSYRLEVIAPQPLEWVKFSDRRPTKLDCDITGDVYVRRQVLGCDWLCGFTSTLNSPTEWLSGIIDNIEFQTRKRAVLDICSSDVRQIEL